MSENAQSTMTLPLEMRPEIASAIVSAQKHAKAVGKDKQNSFHKYKYASAEAIIEEARDALGEAGLAVIQHGWRFEPAPGPVADKEPIGRVFVAYRILHLSGQICDFESSTPVIPEKGRPADKAEFSAVTANLSYTLRGILLLPREDSNGTPPIDGRNDSDFRPSAGSAPASAAPTVAPPAAAPTTPHPAFIDLQAATNQATSLEALVPVYGRVAPAGLPKAQQDAAFVAVLERAFELAASRADLEAWVPAVSNAALDEASKARVRASWERRFDALLPMGFASPPTS